MSLRANTLYIYTSGYENQRHSIFVETPTFLQSWPICVGYTRMEEAGQQTEEN